MSGTVSQEPICAVVVRWARGSILWAQLSALGRRLHNEREEYSADEARDELVFKLVKALPPASAGHDESFPELWAIFRSEGITHFTAAGLIV